jgi:hypothetical protein
MPFIRKYENIPFLASSKGLDICSLEAALKRVKPSGIACSLAVIDSTINKVEIKCVFTSI